MLIKRTFSALFAAIILLISGSATGNCATLYKRYLVKNDLGKDILCEPYIVEKDDYVLKLFKQKGEISNTDFPEFLKIFQRINPGVGDINTISPGQEILIPLKKIRPDAFPTQSTGVIDIPFITIKTIWI